MPTWGSYSYVYGPMMALVAIGILVLVLRWAFGRGSSVVERPPLSGSPDEYGLLDSVASPDTYIEAEILRQRLALAAQPAGEVLHVDAEHRERRHVEAGEPEPAAQRGRGGERRHARIVPAAPPPR